MEVEFLLTTFGRWKMESLFEVQALTFLRSAEIKHINLSLPHLLYLICGLAQEAKTAVCHKFTCDTVDGRTPAPTGM